MPRQSPLSTGWSGPALDPYLSGVYAVQYIKGCQQVSLNPGDKPFPKMLAYLKHYTAYNVETNKNTK